MPNNIPLTPPTDWLEHIARLAKTLDPDYPSATITPSILATLDPLLSIDEPKKPAFILADEEGWE